MSKDDTKATSDETEAMLQAEAQRKRQGLLAIGAALIGSAILLAVMWAVSGGQGPQLDGIAAEGEAEAAAATNDPQCRAFIAAVTDIGQDFRRVEPDLETQLLSDDPAQVRKGKLSLKELRGKLEAQKAASKQAAMRYEDSRKEIETWFDHIDNELRLLDELGDERLAKLEPADGAFEVKFDEDGKPVADPKADPRTPKKRLDAAVVVVYDDFANFRVWHSDRGAKHPCGAADEGETPWTPPAD
jgi:hypothetical protein